MRLDRIETQINKKRTFTQNSQKRQKKPKKSFREILEETVKNKKF